MTFYPQTAQGVLNHVADNPVRCEQLSCCRNIFLRDFYILLEGGKYVVLLLTVIVLIQPSNNLNGILPIILINQLNHLLNDAAFTKKVVREQKLCVISNLLEHTRKYAIQCITLGNQKILIQFIIIVGILISIDFLHIEAVQLHVDCLCQNLRLEGIVLISENTHSSREVAINFHET